MQIKAAKRDVNAKCANCLFYEETGSRSLCLRFPPDKDGNFGRTNEDNWCGEFRIKVKLKR